MRAARPLTAWTKAAWLHWSIQPRRASRGAAARPRAAWEGHPDGDHRNDCDPGPSRRLPEMGARHSAWLSEPDGARAALAADHAGHDLRRGGGGGDAVDRRGRAPEGDGADRADGRA